MKEPVDFIKDLDHYGQDRFHTQLLSSFSLKKLWNFFIEIFLQVNQKVNTINLLNYQSLLLVVIWLVLFVLLLVTQLILWLVN